MAIPETMGERLQMALRQAGYTQITFAKRLGRARNTLFLWIKKSDMPESELDRVCEVLGCSKAWMRYGVRDAREEGIERYVTGYERALDDVREAFGEAVDRLQPPMRAEIVADEKPPREMQGGEEEQSELLPPANGGKRNRRA